MEEEELVGQITMRHKQTIQYSRVVVHFLKGARNIFNNTEITFSPLTLKIGFPTLQSRVFYTVRGCQFNFSYNAKGSNEDFVGKYNVYKIDEDNYQLVKL